MKKRKFQSRYQESVSADIAKPADDIAAYLRSVAMNISADGNSFEIRRHNSFLHLLAPSGKIRITLTPDGAQTGHTTIQGTVIPTIFTYRSAMGFTVLSIIIWSLIFWFYPLNIMMVVIFVLHWIITCFIALYLLVSFMAILTILLLIYNYSDFPVQYIIVAWLVTTLIVHLTLQYNRVSLKKYFAALVSRIKV